MNEELLVFKKKNKNQNLIKRKHHSFAMGAIIITIGMLVVKILGAVFKIPLMSLLGGEGSGYFVSAYNIYNPIYALSTAGLPIAVSRLVSENVTLGKFKDVRKIKKIITPMFLITGTVGFFIILLGSVPYVNISKSPGSLYSVYMLAPTLFFSCLISTYRGYYEGLRQMTPTAMSEIIESAGKVIFGLSFTYLIKYLAINEYINNGTIFGNSFSNLEEANAFILPYASAGALAGVAVSAFVGFIYMYFRDKLKGDGITPKELLFSPAAKTNKNLLKSLLSLSIPIALGAIIMNFAGVIDSVLIQRRLSKIVLNNLQQLLTVYNNLLPFDIINRNVIHIFLAGCYGYTSTIIMFLPTIASGIAISTLPTVTSAWVSGIKDEIKKNIEIIIKLSSVISIPMGFGLSVLSYPIMDLIYSRINPAEKYIAANIMAISAIGAIFTALSTPICSMLQAIGRADLPVKILGIGVVIKIFLNYILVGIPEINIQGAGIGTLICYIFVFSSSLYKLLSITKIKLNFYSIFVKPIISSIICALGAWLTFEITKIYLNTKVSTILAILISIFIYLSLILFLKTLNYNDILALPKGEKIAKFLKLNK